MTARARRILLGGTFFALALGLLVVVARLEGADGRPLLPLGAVVIGAGIAGVLGFMAPSTAGDAEGTRKVLWSGGPPLPAPAPAASSPYRGGAPAPGPPRTSARRTAIVMSACLVFTGAAAPIALHLPRWIEVEVVLAGWWLIWAVVLTVIARRGAEIVDDHTLVLRLPWSPAREPPRAALGKAPRAAVDDEAPAAQSSWWTRIFEVMTVASELEALVFALALAIVMGVALAGAWLVIEVVAPVLFGLAYFGVVRALRRAAKYRGATVRASLVGAGWATAYVGPIAVLVWLVHVAARH